MRSLPALLVLASLSACPAPEELTDAGIDAGRVDSGVPDAGPPRCDPTYATDGGLDLWLAYDVASAGGKKCLVPGQSWTLTAPPRATVSLDISDATAVLGLTAKRGAVTLLDTQLGVNETRKTWFVAGSTPATVTFTLPASAAATADFYVAYSWMVHADSGNVLGVPVADTRAPTPTPSAAPLMASSFLQFSLAEPLLRAADDAGCAALAPTQGYAFYAFELDAGTNRLAHLSIPVFPDFDATLVDAAGVTLASGTLGNELRFSLDAGQRVAFGFRALDAGAWPTCNFDGGAEPETLFLSHRSVAVPDP